ncbi:putative gustatory receptor 58a [Ceratitis capitata]|uniref:putative gustatory receptor 58a n=1 Tax=Ceratitis capitata TaxID=7213 RepID=UPI000329853F|nr:putative gustatory receptor 58a [Ceratitis capitata]
MVHPTGHLLTRRLHYFTLRIAYYHGLCAGFMPSHYNWHNGELHQSQLYLIYSGCIQLGFALGTPYAYRKYLEKSSEIFGDEVKHWTDILTNSGRYLTFTMLALFVWMRRWEMFELWSVFWRLERRYERILPTDDGNTTMHTRWLLLYYFWTQHIVTPLTSIYVLLQFPRQTNAHIVMTFVSWALSTVQVMLAYYTLCLHCHLLQKFEAINCELQRVLTLLRNLASMERTRLRLLTQRLSCLANAHFAYFRLTQRLLGFGQLPFLLILIKCFIVNMTGMHTCVWHIFHLSSLYNLVALLLVVVLYGSLAPSIAGLTWLLSSCNRSGQILRDANVLVALRDNYELMAVLDRFAVYLRSHRLRYIVCGLLDFDLQQCFSLIVVVLVQVTVLIQFDMEGEINKV